MPSQEMQDLVNRYGGQLRQALARNCIAVRVSVHGVTRERTISESKVMIDDKPIEDEFQATGKVKLVPNEIARSLDRIANRARQLPGRYGVQMPGAYLVPIGVGDDGPAARMFNELTALRVEYRTAAETHATRWTEHLERLKTANTKLYESIGRHLRSSEDFIAAHTIDTTLMPLAGIPEDLERTLGEKMAVEGLSDMARRRVLDHMRARIEEHSITGLATERMTSVWAQEAARLTKESMTKTIEQMLSEPMEEFTEALKGLEGILNKGGTVKRASIEKVRTAYEKLSGFGFMVPDELKSRLDGIGRELDPDRARFISGERNQASAKALSDFLKNSREEIGKIEVEQRAVLGAKRILNLDD